MYEVGEGGRSVGMLDDKHDQVCFSPGCTLYVLVEFGENSLEACFVKVPSDDVYAIRMSSLLIGYYELKLAECHVNISIGRDENIGYC